MSELKTLLESSMLNEESKAVISEAFEVAVKAKTDELESQYEAKLVEAKSEMVKDVASMVEEAVTEELEQISEEITHSRTLDVQYAEKLKVFKESYAEKQEETTKIMVAEAVAEVVEELKEDIEMAKKYEFAMAIFENFKGTYDRMFGSDDVSLVDRLNEAEQELDALRRETKLNKILESVSGEKRSVVQTLLENTATDKLEDRFEQLKSYIISESDEGVKDKQLNEGEDANKGKQIDEGVKDRIVIESAEEDDKGASPVDEKLMRSIRLATTR